MSTLKEILDENGMSKYQLSKQSGVPYSTISDIYSGNSGLNKCSAETVVRIGHVLGIPAEKLVGDITYPESGKKPSQNPKDNSLKLYKKSVKDVLDASGELNFLITYVKNGEVEKLFNEGKKKESKYLLSLIDDLSLKYNFPLCKEYDYIRSGK